MKKLRSIHTMFSIPIRLLLAFTCGWFLSFLITKIDTSGLGLIPLLFLGSPLALGILAPLTVRRRSPNLIALSIGTGLLVVAGIYVYWFPLAIQADAQSPADGSYFHVGPTFAMQLLNLFLLYGIVLVLLGAVITSLIIKWNLKKITVPHASRGTRSSKQSDS